MFKDGPRIGVYSPQGVVDITGDTSFKSESIELKPVEPSRKLYYQRGRRKIYRSIAGKRKKYTMMGNGG